MDNVRTVLKFLASLERDEMGNAWTTGPEIHDGLKGRTNIIPVDINDAIKLAKNRNWVKWQTSMGSGPYRFDRVTITPEGRLWIENV